MAAAELTCCGRTLLGWRSKSSMPFSNCSETANGIKHPIFISSQAEVGFGTELLRLGRSGEDWDNSAKKLRGPPGFFGFGF